MENLIKRIDKFLELRDWKKFHSPKNISMALNTEASEISELFLWISNSESYTLDETKRRKLKEEIGDVAIYLFELANHFGIDPIEAAFEKIETNEKKYPAKLVKSKSNKYTDYKNKQ